MGAAVWEFMWLIDKITKIDEEGYGLVLGGKPIQLREISKGTNIGGDKVDGLGSHEVTISKNLQKLEKEGYILITHTPYGIIPKVAKAKKRFSKTAKAESEKRINENAKPLNENAKPNIRLLPKGNTEDISDCNGQAVAESGAKEIVEVIDSFKDVNPVYKKWFENRTQRSATARLLRNHSLADIKRAIQLLPKTNTMTYMPKIHTPLQLEDKWAALVDSLRSEKARQDSEKPKVYKLNKPTNAKNLL